MGPQGPRSTAMMRVVIFCMTLTLGSCLIPTFLPAEGSGTCNDGCLEGSFSGNTFAVSLKNSADELVSISSAEDCEDFGLDSCEDFGIEYCAVWYDQNQDNEAEATSRCRVFESAVYTVTGVGATTDAGCVFVCAPVL